MNANDRIYYTGDRCNESGWFTVGAVRNGQLVLSECDGDRSMTVYAQQIGDVYKGHCDPRFVTEAAYKAYRATFAF